MKIQIGDVVRDATRDEMTAHDAAIAQGESDQAAADAKAAARASARTKLAALGLTDDEIAALLGA